MTERKRRPCHYPPSVLGYCDSPTDPPHWCARITDEDREHADAMAIAARDDWADPWWGRLVFEFDADAYTLQVRTMHSIPDTATTPEETTMTSDNTQPKTPRKPGPWESMLMLIIVLAVVLGFMAGTVALFKWA